MGKSLLKSKTFWVNVVGLALQVSGLVDPKYRVPAMAILNVILRALMSEPITGVLTAGTTPTPKV